MVGIPYGVGDALTYQVLDDETERIIFRSSIRPQLQWEKSGPSTLPEKPIQSFIHLASENTTDNHPLHPSLSGVILPDALIGRSFLLDEDEDGQRH